MAVLTLEDKPKFSAASPPSGPVLRLRRHGDEQTRTVTLAVGKCTVGSSPQCHICLPSRDVRPLHCLLTAEDGVVTATRWAAGVRLNGKDFAKATLGDGDRLSIGSWELAYDAGVSSNPIERPAVVEPKSKPIQAAMIAAAPIAVAGQPPCQPAVGRRHADSSHVFADRLVLDLWTANFRARRRAKALINGIRAARFQADAMAADLSAIETELDLARAAYDSQSANDERLKLEVAEQRLLVEQRVAPLLEELASLRMQLDKAHADLARQTAERERLSAEPTNTQEPAFEPSWPSLDEGSPDLRIGASPTGALAEPTRSVWGALEPPDGESISDPAPERITDGDVQSTSWDMAPEPAAVEAMVETEAPAAKAPGSTWEAPGVQAPSPPVSEPPPADESPAAPWTAPADEQPAHEYSSTSFIDKYRHLLEEDPDRPAPAPAGRMGLVLDDEFLSPAKAETCASPADDSDEALEAYMASMMRRVRSAAPSYDSSQAPMANGPSPSSTLAQLLSSSRAAAPLAEPAAGADLLEEQPFDLEAFRQATRKPAPATDLAALREIANSSARTAIATHRQRKNHESAVSKIAIGLTALASSAYLMASAPTIDGWMFWGGAVTGTIGITAAVQVLLIERRRARDNKPMATASSRG